MAQRCAATQIMRPAAWVAACVVPKGSEGGGGGAGNQLEVAEPDSPVSRAATQNRTAHPQIATRLHYRNTSITTTA